MSFRFESGAEARADMLELLCIAFRLPTEELGRAMTDGSLRSDAAAIASELGLDPAEAGRLLSSYEDSASAENDAPYAAFRAVRQDYTRLFANPAGALVSPYESVYIIAEQGKRTQPVLYISNTAKDLQALYREAGFALSRDVRESADHIACEMFFMRELELRSMQGQDTARQISEFVASHFGRWAPSFFEHAAQAAKEPFYQAVCDLGGQLAKAYAQWADAYADNGEGAAGPGD